MVIHEIAGELSVSVNTVSTHVRNISAKLQARDRSWPCSARGSCGYCRQAWRVSTALT